MTSSRPRLLVRKSLKGVTIQVINPDGTVVAGTWSPNKLLEESVKKVISQSLKKKVKQVTFDRGKHKYHGNVKKIAELARKSGLEF